MNSEKKLRDYLLIVINCQHFTLMIITDDMNIIRNYHYRFLLFILEVYCMRISVVDGFYVSIKAELVDIPIPNNIGKILYDISFIAQTNSSGQNIQFDETLCRYIKPIEVVHLDVSENEYYEPGGIYIEASQLELRQQANRTNILVTLETPDDMVLHLIISPKQLGYGIESPIPSDICNYLISTPIPPNGGEIDIAQYITTKFMYHLSYKVYK